MNTKKFLLEIGVEEIPADYIEHAVIRLETGFADSLTENQLYYSKTEIYSTPRRFALKIHDLQSKQKSETIEKIGPAVKIAYDEKGKLTKAAQGFLRSSNLSEKAIFQIDTPKGKKIAVKFEKAGKKTEDILKDLILKAIREMPFPKKMKWGSSQFLFARPIRWILALFGDEIISFQMEGISSDNISYGNRFQQNANIIKIKKIDEYENKLRSMFVIAARDERKRSISQQLQNAFRNSDEEVIEDKKLIETVTDMVEYPTVVTAGYDKKYLELPEKIIISTLSQHQKYFAVKDVTGEITNKFAFVSNGDPQQSEMIRAGNEKVVKARLEDAEFFYREDTKKPLDSFIPQLDSVTFQADLGSVLEKTDRITKLAEFLTDNLSVSKEAKTKAGRAARLCKADLVTLMLGEKEFTKLQGYIGMQYAAKFGEDKEVCRAIYEHYQPRGQNDELPSSIIGSMVAIADKLDTICGIFGIGLLPTGSNDPFALRRAGNGIVRIIDHNNFELDIFELIEQAFILLKDKLPEPGNNMEKVQEFFRQRIDRLLQGKNIDYDVIESVMHIGYSQIVDLKRRASDLQKFKKRDDFIRLVLGFKRVSNIIEGVGNFGEIDTELFEHRSEQKLFEEFLSLENLIKTEQKVKDYHRMMEYLVGFGKYIDKFFDDVLVNTGNEILKTNRYNLLGKIKELFLNVADISRIVVEGN